MATTTILKFLLQISSDFTDTQKAKFSSSKFHLHEEVLKHYRQGTAYPFKGDHVSLGQVARYLQDKAIFPFLFVRHPLDR